MKVKFLLIGLISIVLGMSCGQSNGGHKHSERSTDDSLLLAGYQQEIEALNDQLTNCIYAVERSDRLVMERDSIIKALRSQ